MGQLSCSDVCARLDDAIQQLGLNTTLIVDGEENHDLMWEQMGKIRLVLKDKPSKGVNL